jgi:hypothetical protein
MSQKLFIVSSMPRLYQHLLSGIAGYETLGNRIVKQIKAAHAFRQSNTVKELSRILINIPIKAYQLIGQYYLVWCKCRTSQYDTEALERIIDQTRTYKSKALVSRAAIAGYQTDIERELYFYAEALKAQPTISEQIGILKSIAVIKAKEKFHQAALKELEAIMSIGRYAEPQGYFDVLNSYAVELGEVGRIQEARNVSHLVLASPFTFAYPGWRETAEDLKPSRRSFVAVSLPNYNVLARPEREPSEQPSLQPKPARVLRFAKWKKKMDKKDKDKQNEKSLDDMSLQDMGFKLLELITTNHADEYQMRLILSLVMNLFSGSVEPPDKPPA